MRAALLGGVAALSLATSALALDTPQPVRGNEPQMRSLVYNPAGRTLLIGTIGRSVILSFGEGENIKRVVTGDEDTWEKPTAEQVSTSPLGNNLPLWPKTVGRTTMQVVTSRPNGATDRVYQFATEVRALPLRCGDQSPCHDDPEATYGLSFLYPQDDVERRRVAAIADAPARAARVQMVNQQASAGRARLTSATARDRLAVDFRCTNWLFEGRGSTALAPDEPCDDGQNTGFRYAGQRPLPSVFLVGADGAEEAIRPTMRGEWLIVPYLRAEIRLRLGNEVVALYNRGINLSAPGPGTGTVSPDVVREVVQASAVGAPQ